MMYSEFVEGTGCRENDINYQVYKELEIIYMNTDCSKEHIYEMGKKLVDNSPSEEELSFREEKQNEIKELKEQIKQNRETIQIYKDAVYHEEDPVWKKHWRDQIKTLEKFNREYRRKINGIKWILTA